MYKKIKVEKFRGISCLELNDPQQFNLFVGKTNCGKTSLLESIFLLSGPTNVGLLIGINNFRGLHLTNNYSWDIIFYKLDCETPIRLYGEMAKTKEKRTLIIEPLKETILTKPDDSVSLSVKDIKTIPSSKISGISMKCSIQKNANKKPQSFESKIIMGKEGLEEVSTKNFPYTIPGQFISPTTYNVSIAKHFNEIQIKKKEKNILKILQKVEPQLVDLSIGAENILYYDIGLNQRLPLNVTGEGLKKILAIILSIYNMSGGVVLIDEIENGLHYQIQEILWRAIFEAAIAFDVQVFATTHSYENVKAFNAAYEKLDDKGDKIRLFRIENEKDKARLVDYNKEKIDIAIERDWEVR
ncbi:ATP/GTP-binding protein [Acidobacteriota bacterium]